MADPIPKDFYSKTKRRRRRERPKRHESIARQKSDFLGLWRGVAWRGMTGVEGCCRIWTHGWSDGSYDGMFYTVILIFKLQPEKLLLLDRLSFGDIVMTRLQPYPSLHVPLP